MHGVKHFTASGIKRASPPAALARKGGNHSGGTARTPGVKGPGGPQTQKAVKPPAGGKVIKARQC